MRFALLMPAAGSGVRLGADRPKALIDVAGVPLFIHAMRPFLDIEGCLSAIIAVPQSHIRQFEAAVHISFPKHRVRIVAGGTTRQESVSIALAVCENDVESVLIHDAARPLADTALIGRVISSFDEDAAAVVPGIPIADTVKAIDGDPPLVIRTVERANLVSAQTPQMLRYDTAVKAFGLAKETGFIGTDDVSLIERFELGKIRLAEGDPRNFKITTKEDLNRARALLARTPV